MCCRLYWLTVWSWELLCCSDPHRSSLTLTILDYYCLQYQTEWKQGSLSYLHLLFLIYLVAISHALLFIYLIDLLVLFQMPSYKSIVVQTNWTLFCIWVNTPALSLIQIVQALVSVYMRIEPWNHRMVCTGKNLKDNLVPNLVPWTGMPFTRPGYSDPHPTWPWTFPGMGQSWPLWATCASFHHPLSEEFLPNI